MDDSRLEAALDALIEMSQALTTVTHGSKVLEQKTLEAAVQITAATAGLLTRTTAEGNQAVIMSLGFPAEVGAMEFQRGDGIIGAVMQSLRATAVPDVSASFDLDSPPDLAAYGGLQAAICVPMLEDGRLWGTISVFDNKNREWSEDDQRVLATLGNQAVVAVRNAELYDDSQRSIWELRNLQEALQAATSTLDLRQVLQQVLAVAAKASSAQVGALALEESGKLILRAAFGTDHATAEKLALGAGGAICRSVMDSGEPVMEAMEHPSGADSPLNPRAVLCVPINLRGKPIGLLFLANYQDGHAFNADHHKLITELAAQAAVAIDNARLFKDREEVTLSSLEALYGALDAAHPQTSAHSKRVTQYALMIARQMRYAPDDQAAWVRLERGGRLHDIGMISVPDAILQKAGPLTDEEFAKMRDHTVAGFNILSGLKTLTDELVVARSHHERFDGKGYPDRKTGHELPIFAWIVSAADAIDAMTSDRLYRRGMPLEVAVEQIRIGAGTHFHPDVAEAVVDAAHNGTLKEVTAPDMAQEAGVGRDHLLYELARDLSSSLGLTDVLRKAMDHVIKLMHASRGFIVLVDSVNDEMSVMMAGGETESEKPKSFLGSRTVIDQVVRTGRAVVSTDASLDDRLKSQQSEILQNLRSIIAVPLVTKGNVIGAVYVDNPFRVAIFEEEDKEFLQAIADFIAIAIDNARLSGSDQTSAPDRQN